MSISLDILINISRVPATRQHVAHIPGLVASLLQLMVVFRAAHSAGTDIFSKICALLQILSMNVDESDKVSMIFIMIVLFYFKIAFFSTGASANRHNVFPIHW